MCYKIGFGLKGGGIQFNQYVCSIFFLKGCDLFSDCFLLE